MTVAELIEELQQVEDKSIPVYFDDYDFGATAVNEVHEISVSKDKMIFLLQS